MADKRERREGSRRRTRLRPGKILDPHGAFVLDCTIVELSATGARIRLSADAPVPAGFRLLDESARSALAARCVWQAGSLAGLHIEGPGEPLDRRAFLLAAGPYYAVT